LPTMEVLETDRVDLGLGLEAGMEIKMRCLELETVSGQMELYK